MELTGKISSGIGQGAYFTQLDWVVKQCQKNLGYKPFPGTLNIRINDQDQNKIDQLLVNTDFSIVPEDTSFCTAQIKKVTVNNITSAIIQPSEGVKLHDHQTLEIISSYNLKHTLGLDDGDQVTIKSENKTNSSIIYKEL